MSVNGTSTDRTHRRIPIAPGTRAVLGTLVGLAAMLLGGCSTQPKAATLTVRNDAMQGVDVHYAVLAADGTPATPGEAGVRHLSVPASGAISQTIQDPTGAIAKAERGSVVMRVLVTLAGTGPEAGQWLELKQPGPFVLRAAPMGAGVRVEREEAREVDDRQIQDLTRNEPPQPGRANRP
jgi:hypothetical protein